MRQEPIKETPQRDPRVRWMHRVQDRVLPPCRRRWESTKGRKTPHPSVTPLHLFSLLVSHLMFFNSHLFIPLLLFPGERLLSQEPARSSRSTSTGEVGGGREERRGATPTHCLAGEDPWPFAPVAFFGAAESVSWPPLLNVERPLTGCRGSRGSIRRESEWEVTEWSAAVWSSTGSHPLDQIWPFKHTFMRKCNI